MLLVQHSFRAQLDVIAHDKQTPRPADALGNQVAAEASGFLWEWVIPSLIGWSVVPSYGSLPWLEADGCSASWDLEKVKFTVGSFLSTDPKLVTAFFPQTPDSCIPVFAERGKSRVWLGRRPLPIPLTLPLVSCCCELPVGDVWTGRSSVLSTTFYDTLWHSHTKYNFLCLGLKSHHCQN